MEALKSPLTFFLIIGLVVAAIDAQDFKCELKSSKQASNYQLSDHARENMLIFSDDDITQTKSNFKAIECECDDTDNQITLDDNLAADLDDEFDNDWKVAAVLLIKKCQSLYVNLATEGTLTRDFDLSPVLILEEIQKLDINQIAAVEGTDPDNDNDKTLGLGETFTSIYIRNATLDNNFNAQFEDKAEVRLADVDLSNDGSNIEVSIVMRNKKWARTSMLTILDSDFTQGDDLDDVIKSNADRHFRIDVTDESPKGEDDDDCEYNYRTKVKVSNTMFGQVKAGDLKVHGADEVLIEENHITYLEADALDVTNAHKISFVRNVIGYANVPFAKIEYIAAEQGSNCDNDDLKDAEIGDVNFGGNTFRHPLPEDYDNDDTIVPPVQFEVDGDLDEDLVKNKFMASKTKVDQFCDCDAYEDVSKVSASDRDDNERVFMALLSDSTCSVRIGDAGEREIAEGLRKDICDDPPKLPPTRKEREDEIRREVKKEWTTYLIVGIVVTLILTAIITALIVKFCCTNRGDVSPRGRA